MASVNFYLRPSKKDLAPLTMRLEHASKQYTTITKILVENDFKKIYKKNVRSPELKLKQAKLDEHIKPLEKFVLDAFNDSDNKEDIPKTWLKEVYKKYLNPNIVEGEKLYITYWPNKVGDDVKVQFNVKTNEWKGKYFTTLSAWKVFKSQSSINQLIVEKCKSINVDKYNSVNTSSPMHHGNKYEDVSIAACLGQRCRFASM